MSQRICRVQRLGMVSHQRAWAYQNQLAAQVAGGVAHETLLLLEHPHTYTLGSRANERHLLWDEATLERQGVEVHRVDRGGDITYHGPGQIVGYPILRLAPIGWHGNRLPQADYVGYIRKLEAVLIRTLAHFAIKGLRVEGKTGVWVQPHLGQSPRKIASIGVKVDARGISRHGFALNVSPEMIYWEGIVPCGLEGVRMTSMAQIAGKAPGLFSVMDHIVQGFGAVFGMQMEPVTAPYLRNQSNG